MDQHEQETEENCPRRSVRSETIISIASLDRPGTSPIVIFHGTRPPGFVIWVSCIDLDGQHIITDNMYTLRKASGMDTRRV